jgi:hypothetical protein
MESKSDQISVLWPLDFVDPQVKETAQYLNQIGSSMLYCFNNNMSSGTQYTFYGKADMARLELIRAYSSGNQPAEIYMDLYGKRGEEKTNGGQGGDANGSGRRYNRKGYTNVDWKVVSPAPQLTRIIDSILGVKGQRIQVVCMSESIQNKKLTMRAEIIFNAKMRSVYEKLGVPMPKSSFETDDEVKLGVYEMLGGFKTDLEIAIERIIEHGFAISKFHEVIEKHLKNDFACFSFGLVRDISDPNTGASKVEYVDPIRAVVAYTESTEIERTPFNGILNKYSIPFLRDKLLAAGLDPDTTEALLEKAAKSYFTSTYAATITAGGSYDWGYYSQRDTMTNRFRYDQFQIDVLEFEYITKDTKFSTETKRDGVLKVGLDEFGKWVNKEHKKTVTYEVHTVLEGLYIPACNYAVGGYQPNVKRINKRQPLLSFCWHKVPAKGLWENAMPRLDQMQIIGLKLQNAIRELKLQGLAIDIRALNIGNVGGQMLTGFDVIEIYKQNGILLYKSEMKANGQWNSNVPIENLSGGLGTVLTELVGAYQFEMSSLMQEMGITPAVAASGKAPELVGLGEQQMEATTNALMPLQEGLEDIMKQAGRNMALRAITTMKHDKAVEDYYRSVIGSDLVDEVMALDDITFDEVGITLTSKISVGQRQAILATLQNAQTADRNGNVSIDPDDVFEVMRMLDKNDLHGAQRYLSVAIADKRKKNEEQTSAASAQQAQQLQQLEQTKAQMALQLEQARAEIEIKKAAALENIKLQAELQKIKAQTDGKIDEIHEEAYVQTLYNVSVNGLVPAPKTATSK